LYLRGQDDVEVQALRASRGALRMAFIDMAMGNGKDNGIDGNKF